jgi:hypothetical protein
VAVGDVAAIRRLTYWGVALLVALIVLGVVLLRYDAFDELIAFVFFELGMCSAILDRRLDEARLRSV